MFKYLLILCLLLSNSLYALDEELLSLKFCFSRWWPYAYEDEGQAKGKEIDLLHQLLDSSNTTITFTELPFRRCKNQLLQGNFDFILDVDESDNLPMIPISIFQWHLTFASAKPDLKNLERITAKQNLRVVFAQEYDYPKALYSKLQTLNAIIHRVSYYERSDEDSEAIFDILKNDDIDVMLVDEVWAKHVIEQHNLDIILLEQAFYTVPLFIGYSEKTNHDKVKLLTDKVSTSLIQ